MNSDGASQILGYMNQHSLEQPIADAVCAAIKARAEQPLRHIAQSLLQECGDDPKEIELERLREETARLKAELALMQKARRGPEQAAGEAKGVQALNVAIYKLGALKHEPPRFEWFDPQHLEGKAALFKEIKLPFAAQTHEVCFDPVTRCVFVSQMTNSVLVRIPVGPNGLLLDDQDAWMVGPTDPRNGDGVSGLHNISLSHKHPGCLWLSLQFSNMLLLVDGATMGVRQVIKVPSLLKRADGTAAKVGGPHCVRECGTSGHIWVALKGAVPCHPGEDLVQGGPKNLKAALNRVCCNPAALKQRMQTLSELGYDTPPPDAFAVWKLLPEAYNPKDLNGELGGRLFECRPSPPMIAIDQNCDAWLPQDRDTHIMHVSLATGAVTQHEILFGPKDSPKITGPAIVTAPDGAVWCSLLGAEGSFVRIDPATGERVIYCVEHPSWVKNARFIHMTFYTHKDKHQVFPGHMNPINPGEDMQVVVGEMQYMLAICSNLVEDDAINALVVLEMEPSFRFITSSRWIPLPTQDSCIHRVEILQEGLPSCDVSAVVTELSCSKLWQIKLEHVLCTNYLTQKKQWRTADGALLPAPVEGAMLVRHFTTLIDQESKGMLDKEASVTLGDGQEVKVYDADGTGQASEQFIDFGRQMYEVWQQGPAQMRRGDDGIYYMKMLDISVLALLGFDYDD